MSNISIEFTNTKRGETPSKSQATGSVYIDYDGSYFSSSSAISSIVIRGGDNTSVGAVSPITPSPFFMTNAQMLSLNSVIRRISNSGKATSFTSSNGSLKELATGIFRTYAG